ncbi:hypothetical protein ILUMI_03099 [Ignelater luminosus]|uniref:Uncharacterized protein n=1 Tax=Ignelater luminosus TaxID=2038154 RepID=A0A8K0DBK8_IGNLU|nr:hypothetical protein ILUMI_03099 [Ignelater luminosus]
MHLEIALSLLFAVISVNYSENKFGSLKNLTKSSQNQESGDHTDPIKTEIKKYMSECGAEVSEEDNKSESKHSNRNSSSSSNGDFNHNNYNRNNNRDQNRRNNNGNWDGSNRGYSNYGGYNTGQGYGGYDSSRDDNRDGLHTSYGSWGGSGSGNYRNPNDGSMRTGYNQSNYGSYGYGRETDGYRSQNSDNMNGRGAGYGGSYGASGRDGYGYRSSYLRTKRSDDDVEVRYFYDLLFYKGNC